jgi:tetrahydromethanopterin S-methyltransferase subunit G
MKITAQMDENDYTCNRVEEVISMLKSLTHKGDCVDGETMQYILERVGMDDQMLRQLIMSSPESDTKDLLEEKIEVNNLRLSCK